MALERPVPWGVSASPLGRAPQGWAKKGCQAELQAPCRWGAPNRTRPLHPERVPRLALGNLLPSRSLVFTGDSLTQTSDSQQHFRSDRNSQQSQEPFHSGDFWATVYPLCKPGCV